jgi:hypothetical protein
MPNYCENDLVISGPEDALAAFMDAARAEREPGADEAFKAEGNAQYIPICIPRLIPVPEEIANCRTPLPCVGIGAYGMGDAEVEWRYEHWGTQSPLLAVRSETRSPGQYTATCDTWWSPPLAAFSAISAAFPLLTFDLRYYERGMSFQGQAVLRAGRVLYEWEGRYDGDRGG